MGNTESTNPQETCECGKPVEESCKYNAKLAGTVKKLYTKHIILCTGEMDWPEKISKDKDSFAGKLATVLKKYQNDDDSEGGIMLTASSEATAATNGGLDIVLYPEAVRYSGVTEDKLEEFVKHIVSKGNSNNSNNSDSSNNNSSDGSSSVQFDIQPVSWKRLILVCTHGTRDKRCGRIGPQVIDSLSQILTDRSVDCGDVAVRGCSHLGGHKHAGVVVVYPEGDWYGQMSARNAEKLVDAYLAKGTILYENWRGRMGETVEESKRRVATVTNNSSEQTPSAANNNNKNNSSTSTST